jgi:hypothetical protein
VEVEYISETSAAEPTLAWFKDPAAESALIMNRRERLKSMVQKYLLLYRKRGIG